MITWLNLFEKYRIDRRLLDIYRDELASLAENSRRRPALELAIARTERFLHAAERLLAHYGDNATTSREALRYADERLFLAFRYLHGLTMEAAAVEMGISRDTVYRIRRRIQERGSVPSAFIAEYMPDDESKAPHLASPSSPALPFDSAQDDIQDVITACFAGAPAGVPVPLSLQH